MTKVRARCLCFGFALSALSLLTPELVVAQDSHYWTNQYGPRSMLLGGAVIGSVHDMSATFYNPGALGYIADPELLLSANAYQVSNLRIQDGGGQGIDLETTDFNLLPNMLAGAFRFTWLGRNKFAYSFLTRHRFDAEVKGGRTSRIDILPAPGDEDFAGGLLASGDAKELWAGLTWARDLDPRVGVGVTTYLSIRSQSRTSEFFAQALTDSGMIALLNNVNNYSSSVYSLLWKAGLAFDLSPVTLGVTLTTPNVQLFGSGEATLNSTVVNVDIDNDGTPDSGFETDFQEDVSANYNSPWSVGAGAGLFLDRTRIHVSVEWFAAVDAYDVLELEPFVSQADGQLVTPSLVQQRDDVFNVAAGVEYDFSERFAGVASFSTDNSSGNPASEVSLTGFDIYHITGGGNLTLGRTQWMLGLSYAWGSEEIEQSFDLNPGSGGAVAGTGDKVDLNYSRWTFMVGFTVKV